MTKEIEQSERWVYSSIGDLVKPNFVAYGIVKAGPRLDAGVPMIRVGDIRNGTIDQENLYLVSPDVAAAYERTKLVGGELLITVQGSVGRTALVPDSLRGGNVSRTVAVLRFNDPLTAAWVHFALETEPMRAEIRKAAMASTKDLLNLRDLRNIKIHLAPMALRARILDSVQEITRAFREVVAEGEAVTQTMKSFLRNLPVEAYEGRLIGSDSWESTTETALLSEVAESSLGKMLDRSRNRGPMRRYLRNANVKWGAFDLTDISSMAIADDEKIRYELSDGDVLICEGGEPGRAAVWQGGQEMYYQKALHRVRCGPALEPEWLVLALRAQAVSGTLSSFFTGTGIMHLTARSLARVPITLPSREVQRRAIFLAERLSKQGESFLANLRSTLIDAELAYRAFLSDMLLPPDHQRASAEQDGIEQGEPRPASHLEGQAMEYPKLTPSKTRNASGNIDRPTVRAILVSLGGQASPVDVLNASKFGGDIDEFYLQLREEILDGSVLEVRDGNLAQLRVGA